LCVDWQAEWESGWVAPGLGKDRRGAEPVTRGAGVVFSGARRPSETPLTFEGSRERAFRPPLFARRAVSSSRAELKVPGMSADGTEAPHV